MVERNLAKVEVESSRLFSRSNFQRAALQKAALFYWMKSLKNGAVTKRLCTGLQIRLARFDSGPRLQIVLATQRMMLIVD